MADLVCAICGQVTHRNAPAQKYCPFCAKERTSRLVKERVQQARLREKAKKQPEMMRCECCGREIERKQINQRYCSECSKDVKKQQSKKAHERSRREKPKEYINCASCGKRIERKSSSHKYCAECAITIRNEKSRDRMKLGPRKGRVCEDCGTDLKDPQSSTKLCPDCAKKRIQERKIEWQATAKPPEPLPKKDYAFLTPSAAPPEWSLKGKSADQVTAEARALGLSYGQYSAYCSSGLIVQYCKVRDVDGLKVTRKAWLDFRRHQKLLHTGKVK